MDIPVEFEGEKKLFVGREDYINRLIKEKLLPLGSIVSLIGPGGSGKTQLAFKAMRKYVEEEKLFDLVIPLYFDRGGITLSALISKIAESLRISTIEFEKETDMKKRTEAVKATLNTKKHPLIYLDNYEKISLDLNKQNMDTSHTPSEDAKQIEYFLKNNLPNNVSILLTSREANNRLGETPIKITGLQNDESQELFSKIARPILGEWAPDSQNVKSIDKIIKATGGHPLSLELIANNFDSIENLEKMAGEMQFKIGESSIYDPEERLRSLQASFDYTVNALGEKLIGLLLRLSIFNSPFPIKAPANILSSVSDDYVYDMSDITQLYNRSLITRIESDDLYGKIKSDYWLYTFHPATKNYVEDKIQKELINNQIQTLQPYEKKNFGYFYLNLLADTYNSIGKDNYRDSFARFNILIQSKDNDFEKSIKYLQDIDDDKSSAYILSYLGLILKEMGQYQEALAYYERSLNVYDRIDDKYGLNADYSNIGLAYYYTGDYPMALEYHTKALAIRETLNDRVGMAGDYKNIGLVYHSMGDYPMALDYHTKAIEMDESLNNRVGMAADYKNIGIVYHSMGDYPMALEYHTKAIEMDESLNDRVGMAGDYNNIGLMYQHTGDYDKALEYHTKALAIRETLNDRVGMAKDYSSIGLVNHYTGDYPKALEYIQRPARLMKA